MNTCCTRVRKKLDAYLDCTCSSTDAGRIREHLASCDACRRLFEEDRRTVGELSDLPRLRCPVRVTDSILERVKAGEKKRSFPTWREGFLGRRAWKPALAFGLILSLAIAWKFDIPKKPKNKSTYSPEEVRRAVDAVKWSMAFSAQTIRRSEVQAIGVLTGRLPETAHQSVQTVLPADGGIEP